MVARRRPSPHASHPPSSSRITPDPRRAGAAATCKGRAMLESIQRHGSVPAEEREDEGERSKERKEKERGKRRGRCSVDRRLARWCGRRRPQRVCDDTTQLLCRATLSSQAQQEVPKPARAAATSSSPPNRSPCWGSRVASGPQAGVEAFPTQTARPPLRRVIALAS